MFPTFPPMRRGAPAWAPASRAATQGRPYDSVSVFVQKLHQIVGGLFGPHHGQFADNLLFERWVRFLARQVNQGFRIALDEEPLNHLFPYVRVLVALIDLNQSPTGSLGPHDPQ